MGRMSPIERDGSLFVYGESPAIHLALAAINAEIEAKRRGGWQYVGNPKATIVFGELVGERWEKTVSPDIVRQCGSSSGITPWYLWDMVAFMIPDTLAVSLRTSGLADSWNEPMGRLGVSGVRLELGRVAMSLGDRAIVFSGQDNNFPFTIARVRNCEPVYGLNLAFRYLLTTLWLLDPASISQFIGRGLVVVNEWGDVVAAGLPVIIGPDTYSNSCYGIQMMAPTDMRLWVALRLDDKHKPVIFASHERIQPLNSIG